jgi:rhomboid protease GluP
MDNEVLTCPKCGALIGPHTIRCRQCNSFVAGSRLESFITELLPANVCPATAILAFFSVLAFIFTSTGPGGLSLMGGSIQKLLEAGSTTAYHVVHGQWWRLVLSNFIHAGILHLGFNLWAGKDVFQLSNSFYKYQRSFLIFFVSGTLTFFTYVLIALYLPFLNSGGVAMGASAGLCGLMGAIVSGARHFDLRAHAMKAGIKRWFLQIVVFGLIVLPIWSTGLHVLGFLFGYALGFIISPEQKSMTRKKLYSYLFLACIALTIICIALQANYVIEARNAMAVE